MQKLLEPIRKLDPKLVATGVTFVLTYAAIVLAPRVGIHLQLRSEIVPGYGLTVGQGIALAAAGIAGWWKTNAASILRRESETQITTPPPAPVTPIARTLPPLEATEEAVQQQPSPTAPSGP